MIGKPVSIRWKLFLTYMVIIMIAFSIFYFSVNETIAGNYINKEKLDLLTRANSLASRLSMYMDDLDQAAVRNIFDSTVILIEKQAEIEIFVNDFLGDFLYRPPNLDYGVFYSKDKLQKVLDGRTIVEVMSSRAGEHLYVSVPVISEKRILGTVTVVSSLASVNRNIAGEQNKILGISFIGMIIVGFASLFFAKLIATPVENLTIAAKEAAAGKFDVKLKVRGHDEISNLGRAFNVMTTKLGQTEKQRRDFVENVSHELKTPISSIIILTELIQQDEEMGKETLLEFLRDIHGEANRMAATIDDLLALVDMGQESIQTDYRVTYVNYLIKNVMATLAPLAEKKKVRLSFKEGERVQIRLDQSKIQRCLLNIIGNAIKYTEKGYVKVSLNQDDKCAVIMVEDTGIGIASDEIPHIFDRFYRVDKSRTRKTGGSGLGLSIARQIVELHQGSIDVWSEEGAGTRFVVRIPKNLE